MNVKNADDFDHATEIPDLPPEIIDLLHDRLDHLQSHDRSLIVLAAIEAVATFAAEECVDFALATGAGLEKANQRGNTYAAALATNIKRTLLDRLQNSA